MNTLDYIQIVLIGLVVMSAVKAKQLYDIPVLSWQECVRFWIVLNIFIAAVFASVVLAAWRLSFG